jgi:hypothetical protein
MNALSHTHTNDPPGYGQQEGAVHDRVRVPGGREGEVIGFYQRRYRSVLVRFASGGSAEVFTAEVEWLS